MNALLEKAIGAMTRLPEQDQEALAGLIFSEIESEKAWSASFHKSQDQLGELVRRAREEVEAGQEFSRDPSSRSDR